MRNIGSSRTLNRHSSRVWRRKMLTGLAAAAAAAVVAVAEELLLIDYVVRIAGNFAPCLVIHSLERIHFAMLEMVTGTFAAIESKNFGLSLHHTEKRRVKDGKEKEKITVNKLRTKGLFICIIIRYA